jgi:Fur family transcriptional regulator, ferric uptake regulator
VSLGYHQGVTTDEEDWSAHARTTLDREGYRAGAARTRVVDVLARQDCCATAQQIADELREGDARVGIASVYRALEVLDRLGLVHRLDVGDGTARYEAAHPGGEHHHHVVCDRCGRVAQFADDGLEQAIHTLSQRLEFAIDQHDVVLRGTCPNCRQRAAKSTAIATR